MLARLCSVVMLFVSSPCHFVSVPFLHCLAAVFFFMVVPSVLCLSQSHSHIASLRFFLFIVTSFLSSPVLFSHRLVAVSFLGFAVFQVVVTTSYIHPILSLPVATGFRAKSITIKGRL